MKFLHAPQVRMELCAPNTAFETRQNVLKGQGFFERLTHAGSPARLPASGLDRFVLKEILVAAPLYIIGIPVCC